ncbi:Hypothetical protein Y17_3785 [Pectobacterium wasabiae CFBP 3304]|uniref:Uncharacterized protein n=1 Tax=Pectobacterium aquaticum TaxID=2204145 RepID=A0A426J1F8_9GAMM|nr:Hypothetical protein Y17_3785 [Pectobacterium wasabiae CFBP 3304]RRO06979.1 hypothetical protein DMB85_015140 [Pectobacterium aquaticum]
MAHHDLRDSLNFKDHRDNWGYLGESAGIASNMPKYLRALSTCKFVDRDPKPASYQSVRITPFVNF